MEIKNVIFLFIRSQMADAGPPLGTVLGNIGINSLKFCKEFNDFTKDLPNYFILKVKILIMEDRSYNFIIFLPTIGFIIMFTKYQYILKIKHGEVRENYITLKNVIQLAKSKFPNMPISSSLRLVIGTIKSCNVKIYI